MITVLYCIIGLLSTVSKVECTDQKLWWHHHLSELNDYSPDQLISSFSFGGYHQVQWQSKLTCKTQIRCWPIWLMKVWLDDVINRSTVYSYLLPSRLGMNWKSVGDTWACNLKSGFWKSWLRTVLDRDTVEIERGVDDMIIERNQPTNKKKKVFTLELCWNWNGHHLPSLTHWSQKKETRGGDGWRERERVTVRYQWEKCTVRLRELYVRYKKINQPVKIKSHKQNPLGSGIAR